MTRYLIIALAALLTAACGRQDPAGRPETQAGQQAALDWITRLDAGDYTGTWHTAAAYFRSAVPCEQWVTSLGAFRTPMGAVVSRQVKSARRVDTLPGAPDGQYVLIEYRTAFAHKKAAVETATVMLETGDVWRVSGYFIR